jgi:hypothetical protein
MANLATFKVIAPGDDPACLHPVWRAGHFVRSRVPQWTMVEITTRAQDSDGVQTCTACFALIKRIV